MKETLQTRKGTNMKFTTLEMKYACVMDCDTSTASEIEDFYTLMKYDGRALRCKEWAKLFYGKETMNGLYAKSCISKISAMMTHLDNYVKRIEKKGNPITIKVREYAWEIKATGEILYSTIEVYDKDGNKYEIENPKINKYGYSQRRQICTLREKTITPTITLYQAR